MLALKSQIIRHYPCWQKSVFLLRLWTALVNWSEFFGHSSLAIPNSRVLLSRFDRGGPRICSMMRPLLDSFLGQTQTSDSMRSRCTTEAAKRRGGLRAPGRILWYVSKGDEQSFPGPQAITACSLLDEVLVGKPKDLYRSFRRLGVYEWKDVLALAGGTIDTEIMALRFSRTEKFERKIPLVELKALNIPDPFSPRLIEPEQFNRIYALGTALNS